MLELLFTQHSHTAPTATALAVTIAAPPDGSQLEKRYVAVPALDGGGELFPDFWAPKDHAGDGRPGLTVELWLASALDVHRASDSLLESYAVDQAGAAQSGLGLRQSWNGTVTATMVGSGGPPALGSAPLTIEWSTDPACSRQLAQPGSHYLALVLDPGPMMVSFMVDGKLCDGGPLKTGGWRAGWSLLPTALGSVAGGKQLALGGRVKAGALYRRAFFTTELIGNWRHGIHQEPSWIPAAAAAAPVDV
jgi:hypothetical protein